MSLPRHFAARPPGVAAPVTAAPPRHALDVFRLLGPAHSAGECVVAAGVDGRLQLLASDDHRALPAPVLAGLSHHEVASGSKPRILSASEVLLFNVQLVEQPTGTPGLNDPVYLYGTLFGPFPSTSPGTLLACDGQLTVTRADILAALVDGVDHAFHSAGLAADARCFHMLLPADRDDVIHQGRGIVLAYLLHPSELLVDDPSNGLIVTQLLHDLLRALQSDLKAEGVAHPLVEKVLPVPSRPALVSELEMQGYVIKGNVATRKKGTAARGIGGAFINMFGALLADRIELPPEGTLREFVELARETLKALPGWPTSRHLALRQCMGARVGGVSARVPSTVAPVTTVQAPRVVPPPSGNRDWMADFMQQHQAPGKPPPRVTSTTPARPFKPSQEQPRAKKADWMSDFGGEAEPAKPDQPEPAPSGKGGKKPDWMKDFE